jgi:hypothetical protein
VTNDTLQLDSGPALQEPVSRSGGGRRVIYGLVIGLIAVAVVITVVGVRRFQASSESSAADTTAYPTALATVAKVASLSSRTQVNGRVNYAGSYSVVGHGAGIITALPQVGSVVAEGQVLFRLDEQPVVLLYGSTPMHRSLARGTSGSDLTGDDVRQLNGALVALGDARGLGLNPNSDKFSRATELAVERLQAHLGVKQTGRLDLSQVVFLPTAARITTVSATLGASAPPGTPIIQATSTQRQVTVALDAAQQRLVQPGDTVTIAGPTGRTTPGVVSTVGTVATAPPASSSGNGGSSAGSSSSSPTITVNVLPSDPNALGDFDQEPVQVTIIAATVTDALAVPVTALLSQPNGQFALEVVDNDGRHKVVAVQTGLFDDADGLVQVTGSDVAAGQHVVVPTV